MTSSPTSSNCKSPDVASSPSSSPIKIAVIGSGLSGLVSAYLLTSDLKSSSSSTGQNGGSQRQIQVHIFERAKKIGMDSNSISVRTYDDDDQDDQNQRKNPNPDSGLLDGTLNWIYSQMWNSKEVERNVRPEMERKKGQRRIDVPMRSFNVGESKVGFESWVIYCSISALRRKEQWLGRGWSWHFRVYLMFQGVHLCVFSSLSLRFLSHICLLSILTIHIALQVTTRRRWLSTNDLGFQFAKPTSLTVLEFRPSNPHRNVHQDQHHQLLSQ